MIIECPYCEAKVKGEVLAEHEDPVSPDELPFKSMLVVCPSCGRAMFAGHERLPVFQRGSTIEIDEWDEPVRLWPPQDRPLDRSIPALVRDSLAEARRCFSAKAYTAVAVMAGRAIEATSSDLGVAKSKTFQSKLKDLLDRGVIDKKIYEWGDELRKHRNVGAHPGDEKIDREDARDILDFAMAIIDYIYVLTSKFERFKRRKQTPGK